MVSASHTPHDGSRDAASDTSTGAAQHQRTRNDDQHGTHAHGPHAHRTFRRVRVRMGNRPRNRAPLAWVRFFAVLALVLAFATIIVIGATVVGLAVTAISLLVATVGWLASRLAGPPRSSTPMRP